MLSEVSIKADARIPITYREITQSFEYLATLEVVFGVFSTARHKRKRSSKSRRGTKPTSSIRLLDLAIIHEYGAPRASIPARPFLRPTLRRINREVNTRLRKIATYTGKTSYTKEQVKKQLEAIGKYCVKETKNTIKRMKSPPLSPITIARKGHAKLLIDTMQLFDSISFKVRRVR